MIGLDDTQLLPLTRRRKGAKDCPPDPLTIKPEVIQLKLDPECHDPKKKDEDFPDSWKKVRLAKRMKLDSNMVVFVEVLLLCIALILLYFCYFHFHVFHYHVTRGYAHLGHVEAQHLLGSRLLKGHGVLQDHGEAMKWFRTAADAGHPHAAYNLAIGHLSGYKTDVEEGEAHLLVRHAAENGVEDAWEVLDHLCSTGQCDMLA